MAATLVFIIQILAVVSSVLMVFLILLQEPKSGGLALLGGTGLDRSIGVSNPLRKATVYLAILFMLGALLAAMYYKSARHTNTNDELARQVELANALNNPDQPAPGVTPPVSPAQPNTYSVKIDTVPGDATNLVKAAGELLHTENTTDILKVMAPGKTFASGLTKEKADSFKQALEAKGATVTIVAGPATAPAEKLVSIKLTAAGSNLEALRNAIGQITGVTDPAAIQKHIDELGVLTAKPESEAKKDLELLEKAGAKAELIGDQSQSNANPPAEPPAMTPTPGATAPAPAPTANPTRAPAPVPAPQ